MRGIYFDGDKPQFSDAIEVRDPEPDEVIVKIEAAGLCHSDVSVIDKTIPFPTPVVLGHEGAGIVEQIGDAVTSLQVGDRVMLSTLGNCGRCAACESGKPTHCKQSMGKLQQPFTIDGKPAWQFANTSVFVERTVVKSVQAVKFEDDIDFPQAALVGCGVITGVGAVLNRAKVEPGASVLVIGAGGIGLNVVQAAAATAANPIIVVDANPDKEKVAREFGATHVIIAGEGVDTAEEVKKITPDGVDYAFECVGHTGLIRQAIDLLDWGGTCVMVGVPPMGQEASFVVASMYNDKSVTGCRYGAGRPNRDFPMILDWYRAGKLKLDELVSRTYPIEQFDEALEDLHKGELARGVLVF